MAFSHIYIAIKIYFVWFIKKKIYFVCMFVCNFKSFWDFGGVADSGLFVNLFQSVYIIGQKMGGHM